VRLRIAGPPTGIGMGAFPAPITRSYRAHLGVSE